MTQRTTITYLSNQLLRSADGARNARRWLQKKLPPDDLHDLWLADLLSAEKAIDRVIDGLNRQKENAT